MRSTSDDAAVLGLDVVLRVVLARAECGGGDKMVRCVVWPAASAFKSASKTQLARKSLRPLSTLLLTRCAARPGLGDVSVHTHRDAVAAKVHALSCLGVSVRSVRLATTTTTRTTRRTMGGGARLPQLLAEAGALACAVGSVLTNVSEGALASRAALRNVDPRLRRKLGRLESNEGQDKIQAATQSGSRRRSRSTGPESAASVPRADAREVVGAAAREVMGTMVEMKAPLMSAGLDSIAATAFVSTLAARMSADIAPTALFDHPTLESIASFLSGEVDRDNTVRCACSGETRERAPVAATRSSVAVAGWSFSVAGRARSRSALLALTTLALAANTRVPAVRWSSPTPGAGPSATYGSFASEDQLGLDHGAFGISAAEARSMDPQQSLVLCVGYGALRDGMFELSRDSKVARDTLTNSGVGVFVGVEASGLVAGAGQANAFSASGGTLSVTSGRLSYSLGLVGPCYSIDTACASALAALHTCVVALKTGSECEDGLGVGTKVLSEAVNVATAVGGMTSALGRCHTFDVRADGYCRGEGCGAFLLRGSNYSNCEAAILGSAVQQDGPSASLTAPNGSSQKRLIEAVRGGIAAAAGVQSLEAHGTGTALGDPIEVPRRDEIYTKGASLER